MIVTNSSRFAVSGGTLKFKVSTGGAKVQHNERVAILTVPADASAAIDAKEIRVEHDDAYGRNVKLLKDEVTLDGAPYVRYSAKFTNGIMLIVF